MNKLMMAMAVAVFTGVASASSIKWSSDEVSGAAADNLVYCFLASDSSGSTAAAKLLAAATAAEYASQAKTVGNLTSYASKVTSIEDGAFVSGKTADNASWGSGVSVSAYAIVFNADTLSDATKYAITSVSSTTFANAGQTKTLDFDMTSAVWGDITPEPEPTSGLLLLVGVAGLALRRRRA